MTQDITPSAGPNQEEKVMAALAHIAVLLPLMGLVAPIVIWATQKDKSAYVNFQALQAVAYQISLILVWFLGMGCYMCSFFGTVFLVPAGATVADGREEVVESIMMLSFMIPFAVMMTMFGIFAIFIIYGLVASIMTLQGRPFQYIFVGKRVKRFMEK